MTALSEGGLREQSSVGTLSVDCRPDSRRFLPAPSHPRSGPLAVERSRRDGCSRVVLSREKEGLGSRVQGS